MPAAASPKMTGVAMTTSAMMIAVGVTPLLYLGHSIIDRYLGIEESHRLIESSAQANAELAVAEPN